MLDAATCYVHEPLGIRGSPSFERFARGSGTHESFGRCEKPGIDCGSSLVLESPKNGFKQVLHLERLYRVSAHYSTIYYSGRRR